MNILLLGATGRVGQLIMQRALADEHQVNALVRTPSKLHKASPLLTVYEGNVLDPSDIDRAISNSNIVVSALGTDKNNTLSRSMPFIIKAMEKNGVSRIITIGTAGILNSRTQDHLYRFESNESKRKTTRAAQDHLAAYQYLKESLTEWTVVCPTYLPDGEEKGNYRVEKDVLPEDGKSITTEDTAAFAYSQLDSTDFVHSRVGIAY